MGRSLRRWEATVFGLSGYERRRLGKKRAQAEWAYPSFLRARWRGKLLLLQRVGGVRLRGSKGRFDHGLRGFR